MVVVGEGWGGWRGWRGAAGEETDQDGSIRMAAESPDARNIACSVLLLLRPSSVDVYVCVYAAPRLT